MWNATHIKAGQWVLSSAKAPETPALPPRVIPAPVEARIDEGQAQVHEAEWGRALWSVNRDQHVTNRSR